jgi:hypothetical protein
MNYSEFDGEHIYLQINHCERQYLQRRAHAAADHASLRSICLICVKAGN